ncbi:hypothetical protein JG688_00017786 [Phytophthora aleatoria]|uniref:Uncharacterized protein n=1 Tax=Phytophthora aleatoria TaxID=2496075 RepID=A0A8J5IQC0_9STRA|nr:hypothetical protein JG688_00017786 [Phytophthora aleatoria]
MQRTSHPASTLKQRLRTSMRTWGNDVTRFPRCFFTQVRRLRGRPPAVTRQLRVLAAASQPRRSPRSPSPISSARHPRAADRLAIAGALATAQAAKVMRSVGLDADEVEQVGVVDVAKVKQSAVGDAVELQDSAVVDVFDETTAIRRWTTMTAKTLRV